MAINSKQKGKEFERKVAKMLTEWSGQEFNRTPQSGALHWNNDKRVVSDIVSPQTLTDWPFSIECKKVEYPWEFSTIIEGTSLFWEHWQQCWDDSQREQLRPLLVFCKNYRDTFAVITYQDFEKINVTFESFIRVTRQDFDLVILKFKDFLEKISLDTLLSKNLLK